MGSSAGFTFVIALLVIFVAVMWILLPFLIMGTNRRLNELLASQQEATRALKAMEADLGQALRRAAASK